MDGFKPLSIYRERYFFHKKSPELKYPGFAKLIYRSIPRSLAIEIILGMITLSH